MEEIVLIESTLDKKKFKIWNIVWLVISIIFLILAFIALYNRLTWGYDYAIEEFKTDGKGYDGEWIWARTEDEYAYYNPIDDGIYTVHSLDQFLNSYKDGYYSSKFSYAMRNFEHYYLVWYCVEFIWFCFHWGSLLVFLISALLKWLLSKCQMKVTDKNVYGTTLFGKKVVLPIHMVSAYSISKLLSTVAVTTASGVTKFSLIENWEEIGNVLSRLINKRQEDTAKQSMQSPQQQSGLDELKKLKELLDLGILTQEEYDEKKKQMLKL